MSTNPVLTAVLANRFDAIVREMTNTLMRSARSAVIGVARDFSCTIVSADDELVSAAEGVAVHVFGSHLQCASMTELHPDLRDGDAFLHNDPYLGNTHAADHTVLVPVFFDDAHVFTVTAKAHQADVGNSIRSSYHAWARDVYEEGALVFPCVRLATSEGLVDDVIRMCKARIRVPDQWYGDMLAMLGAARIGQRRLTELCTKYGLSTVRGFVREWLDYSERRMAAFIEQLPAAQLTYRGSHDPIPDRLPEGVPLNVSVHVDPERGRVEIDLRDNIDCVDAGLNQSEACAVSNVLAGLFNCIADDVPKNEGAFRRVQVHLRDGCVVGRPTFPHSCSLATTNIAARLANFVQACMAQLGDGYGLAEGGGGNGVGRAVVSGTDFRRDAYPYINQLWAGMNGGPAGPHADGWVNYNNPTAGGVMYRDSIELDELKHPIHFESVRLLPGGFGAGRCRGAPGYEVVYGPKRDPMHIVIACDAQYFPPRGVLGGHDGPTGASYKVHRDGTEERLPNFVELTLEPGERVRGVDNGGGGYGDPLDRPPERVCADVVEGWETFARAEDLYGVVFVGAANGFELAADEHATRMLRAQRRQDRVRETAVEE